jgi:hypothetical protein
MKKIIAAAAIAALTLAACASEDAAPVETQEPVEVESAEDTVATEPPAPVETEAPVETTEAPSDSGTLALGEYADVGDWNLTVVSVVRDDQVVPYEPEPGVEYAGFKLTITGTYSGESEGNLFWDVTVKYIGADSRIYNDFDSYNSDFSSSSVDTPSVVAGGTQSIEMTLAVPVSALGAEVFTVAPLFDFGDNGVQFAWDS